MRGPLCLPWVTPDSAGEQLSLPALPFHSSAPPKLPGFGGKHMAQDPQAKAGELGCVGGAEQWGSARRGSRRSRRAPPPRPWLRPWEIILWNLTIANHSIVVFSACFIPIVSKEWHISCGEQKPKGFQNTCTDYSYPAVTHGKYAWQMP